MARILIVDDEENIRLSLKTALEKRGHSIVTAAGCNQAREFLAAGFDLVILDVKLPDGDGIELLQEIRKRTNSQQVIMISGHADIDVAVKAIQQGAYDFIEKPLALDRILITINNATRADRLSAEKNRLSTILYGELIGESPVMTELKKNIQRAAAKASRFLLLGANGTGKELAAYLLHQQSKFADGPFVAVNCAALPSELVESELFGHRQGAFTGATRTRKGRFVEADGGTIFLDEISEMSLEAQAKILRVVETREVTPVGSDTPVQIAGNVVAASNRDLEQMVRDKTFRQDLFYRLNVVTLRLPRLSERADDIPLLANHFLGRSGDESGEPPRKLSGAADQFLKGLDLPGNVRELKNLMERVNIYCDEETVDVAHLRSLMPLSATTEIRTLKEAVEQFEHDYIKTVLNRNDDNMARAARELGLERSHLYKKLKKFDS